MGRVFSNRIIISLAALFLFLSSLPVGGTQPAAYLDELKALAELHEQGMLTDEEFAAKKAQLLGLEPKETTLETAEEPTLSQEQAPDAGQPRKIKLPEGTEVHLVFAEALSSGANTEGDRFDLRVDDDVKVDGTVVIPRGAIAVGTVKVAKGRRRMGRAGQLSIMIDYVKAGDERVRLRSNKTKEGDGKVGSTIALTVLFGPLGLLKRGKDIEVQKGSPITAFVDQDVVFAIKGKESMEDVLAIEQLAKEDEPAAEIKTTSLRCANGHEYPSSASFEFCPEDGLRLGAQEDRADPTGLVEVQGVQGAMLVFVDGLFQGRGNVSVSLEPGWHSLEIRPTASGDDNCWEEEVSIEPGETTTVNASESCGL